jgi:hypothetical protein
VVVGLDGGGEEVCLFQNIGLISRTAPTASPLLLVDERGRTTSMNNTDFMN